MTIHITLNTGDVTYNDNTYNISKCNIAYMFLSIVLSKVIYKWNQLWVKSLQGKSL